MRKVNNMENLKQAIRILNSVEATMDTISVVGIDNQDKFVGCAQAVKTVVKQISEYIDSTEKEDVTNG